MNSCVDQIDFAQSPENSLLVVDGQITLGPGPHKISLRELGDFGAEPNRPISNAKLTLIEDSLRSAVMTEIEGGTYQLAEGEFVTTVGKKYEVLIELENGNAYRSLPEIMPQSTQLDSVYYETTFEEELNERGRTVEDYYLAVFVDGEIPVLEDGPFIRWKVEESYNFVELPSPNPLDQLLVCYFNRDTDPQAIRLFDGGQSVSPFIRKEQVARIFIDWTFEQRHYIRVFQQSLTAEAFEYWQNIDQVTNQVGSIFDVPPAGVPGNIINENDPNELVLGYVQAVAVDTALTFTVPAFLSEIFIPTYCQLNFRPSIGFPSECFNCIIFDGATYERPDYWD